MPLRMMRPALARVAVRQRDVVQSTTPRRYTQLRTVTLHPLSVNKRQPKRLDLVGQSDGMRAALATAWPRIGRRLHAVRKMMW